MKKYKYFIIIILILLFILECTPVYKKTEQEVIAQIGDTKIYLDEIDKNLLFHINQLRLEYLNSRINKYMLESEAIFQKTTPDNLINKILYIQGVIVTDKNLEKLKKEIPNDPLMGKLAGDDLIRYVQAQMNAKCLDQYYSQLREKYNPIINLNKITQNGELLQKH